jgi:hypothetical protein
MKTKLFTRAETCSKKKNNKQKNVETETYCGEYLENSSRDTVGNCGKNQKSSTIQDWHNYLSRNIFWPVFKLEKASGVLCLKTYEVYIASDKKRSSKI